MPKNQRKIFLLIGETYPHLLDNSMQNNLIDDSIEFSFSQSFESFKKENLSDFIKTFSTKGSHNSGNEMLTNDKKKFLSRKIRIGMPTYKMPKNLLVTKVTSELENDKRGKSLIQIEDAKSTIFTFEIDYHILNKTLAEKQFSEYSSKSSTGNLFPNSITGNISDYEFNLRIEELKKNLRLGHIDLYPIVPAVFITKWIVKSLFQTMLLNSLNTIVVDNVEIYLTNPMPINTILKVKIKAFKLLKNLKIYKCNVFDHTTEYGHYLITLKI